MLNAAIAAGSIKKSGAFLSFGAVKLGQGFEAAKTYLKTNPSVREDMLAGLREKIKTPPDGAEDKD